MDIFDQKKGLKVKEMLAALPSIDLYVLDSLCDFFDKYGEEKSIKFDAIQNDLLKYTKQYSISKIDQQ